MRRAANLDGARGASIVEVLVALVIFSVGVLGFLSAGTLATRETRRGAGALHAWSAAQAQLERLRAQGYDRVTDGSARVQGYSLEWKVVGARPKRIVLVVGPLGDGTAPDTFVTYLTEPEP